MQITLPEMKTLGTSDLGHIKPLHVLPLVSVKIKKYLLASCDFRVPLRSQFSDLYIFRKAVFGVKVDIHFCMPGQCGQPVCLIRKTV